MDCTRLSCCERDLRTQETNRLILNELRRHDPIRKRIIERQSNNTTTRFSSSSSFRELRERRDDDEEEERQKVKEECNECVGVTTTTVDDELYHEDEEWMNSEEDEEDDDDYLNDTVLKRIQEEFVRRRLKKEEKEEEEETMNRNTRRPLRRISEFELERIVDEDSSMKMPRVLVFLREEDESNCHDLRSVLRRFSNIYLGTEFMIVRVETSGIDVGQGIGIATRHRLGIRTLPAMCCLIQGESVAGISFDQGDRKPFGNLNESDERLRRWLAKAGGLVEKAPKPTFVMKKTMDSSEEEEEKDRAYHCGHDDCAIEYYHEHINKRFFQSETKTESFMERI